MSNTPTTPIKRRSHLKRNFSNTLTFEDNNNVSNKILEHAPGRTFAMWYKSVVDHDRYNIGAYLADGVVLEWFGRTIRTRKKVFSFMKYDMQCSNHDFTTIESKHAITLRGQIKARYLILFLKLVFSFWQHLLKCHTCITTCKFTIFVLKYLKLQLILEMV